MQNFETAIKKVMIAFEQNGQIVANDFTSVSKIVSLGSSAEREIKDYLLFQFACYLVAQNGGPRKPEIAAAQAYFAISTWQFEIAQLLADQEERINLRERVSDHNKALASAAVANNGFHLMRAHLLVTCSAPQLPESFAASSAGARQVAPLLL